jgi:mono/diheme cytochrome c family protein
MKHGLPFLALLAAFLACGSPNAQSADPKAGLGLAQQVCGDCHAVRRMEAPSPKPGAPTFQELASAPGMTRAALTVALTTPHAGMPMFRLSDGQRADVIAYILSLR